MADRAFSGSRAQHVLFARIHRVSRVPQRAARTICAALARAARGSRLLSTARLLYYHVRSYSRAYQASLLYNDRAAVAPRCFARRARVNEQALRTLKYVVRGAGVWLPLLCAERKQQQQTPLTTALLRRAPPCYHQRSHAPRVTYTNEHTAAYHQVLFSLPVTSASCLIHLQVPVAAPASAVILTGCTRQRGARHATVFLARRLRSALRLCRALSRVCTACALTFLLRCCAAHLPPLSITRRCCYSSVHYRFGARFFAFCALLPYFVTFALAGVGVAARRARSFIPRLRFRQNTLLRVILCYAPQSGARYRRDIFALHAACMARRVLVLRARTRGSRRRLIEQATTRGARAIRMFAQALTHRRSPRALYAIAAAADIYRSLRGLRMEPACAASTLRAYQYGARARIAAAAHLL